MCWEKITVNLKLYTQQKHFLNGRTIKVIFRQTKNEGVQTNKCSLKEILKSCTSFPQEECNPRSQILHTETNEEPRKW